MQSSRGYRRQQYTQNGAYAQRQYDNGYEKPNAFLSALLYIITITSIFVFICLIVLRSLGVGHFIRSSNVHGFLVSATEGDEHTYYIVNQVNGLYFHDQELDLYDVAYFVLRDSVSDEIGVIVDGYANALSMGNLEHHVTTEDIVQMTRNLEDDFYELFDYRMTEEDREHLASTLDDVVDFDSLTINAIMEDYDLDLRLPLMLISPMLLGAVGLLCILLLAVIFIIRRGNPPEGALAVGIALAFSGLAAFITGAIMGANPEFFISLISESLLRIGYTQLIEDPAHLLSQYGFLFAAVGVVTIIISIMVTKVSQRNRRV